MKKNYSAIVGLGLLVLGVVVLVVFMGVRRDKDLSSEAKTEIQLVSANQVYPESMRYVVNATGIISALRSIELYSEVQGTLLESQQPFKEGNRFGKGQVILKIDNSEHLAQLQSSKSTLVSELAAMLADMEIEFPEAAKKWEGYLTSFDVKGSLEPLPSFSSDTEKFFVIGRNIYQTYFNVKNLQERLSKYTISAPFDGVVTEANVDPGALVRNGQKLGEFMDNSVFELELAIPVSENQYLQIGQPVLLKALKGDATYKGNISRINPKINRQTQTIEVFVEVKSKQLKDGQYLEAEILGSEIDNVVKIQSNLLIENNQVYIVVDSTLQLQKVTPVNFVGDYVIVEGLSKGMILVKETVANAYPGQKVTY